MSSNLITDIGAVLTDALAVTANARAAAAVGPKFPTAMSLASPYADLSITAKKTSDALVALAMFDLTQRPLCTAPHNETDAAKARAAVRTSVHVRLLARIDGDQGSNLQQLDLKAFTHSSTSPMYDAKDGASSGALVCAVLKKLRLPSPPLPAASPFVPTDASVSMSSFFQQRHINYRVRSE